MCTEKTQVEQPTNISEHKEWVAREVTEAKHTTNAVDNTYRRAISRQIEGPEESAERNRKLSVGWTKNNTEGASCSWKIFTFKTWLKIGFASYSYLTELALCFINCFPNAKTPICPSERQKSLKNFLTTLKILCPKPESGHGNLLED